MTGSMIEVADGDALPAYVALPSSGGSGPGVIVIQEWWGLVPHIKSVADRFAREGFVALAPDLYRGKATAEPDEAAKLLMEMRIDQAAKDLSGTVDQLLSMTQTTGTRVGVVGFGMGGGLAIKLATIQSEVGAVVSYYGFPRQDMSWDLGSIQGAVLGHYADHDDLASLELAQDMERELLDAGVPATFYVYPRASHAFFNDDRPEVYDQASAELSWQRTVEFLKEHLGHEQPVEWEPRRAGGRRRTGRYQP
jgi:carboxymethylenebutenolidase